MKKGMKGTSKMSFYQKRAQKLKALDEKQPLQVLLDSGKEGGVAWYATLKGDLETLRVCLDTEQRHVDKKYGLRKEALLHAAAQEDHVHIIKELVIRRKATVDIKDWQGRTPLLMAGERGKEIYHATCIVSMVANL